MSSESSSSRVSMQNLTYDMQRPSGDDIECKSGRSESRERGGGRSRNGIRGRSKCGGGSRGGSGGSRGGSRGRGGRSSSNRGGGSTGGAEGGDKGGRKGGNRGGGSTGGDIGKHKGGNRGSSRGSRGGSRGRGGSSSSNRGGVNTGGAEGGDKGEHKGGNRGGSRGSRGGSRGRGGRSSSRGKKPVQLEKSDKERLEELWTGRKKQMKGVVGEMNTEELLDLMLKLVDREPGLVFDLCEAAGNQPDSCPPSPKAAKASSNPSWCRCGNCRHMPSDVENKCCGCLPRNCISTRDEIERLVLDPQVLALGQQYYREMLGRHRQRVEDQNKCFR